LGHDVEAGTIGPEIAGDTCGEDIHLVTEEALLGKHSGTEAAREAIEDIGDMENSGPTACAEVGGYCFSDITVFPCAEMFSEAGDDIV
jgi:hypothetical protein